MTRGDDPRVYANVTPFVHCVDRSLLQPVVCDDLVRLGSPNDGGYVVPARAIARASTLLSFGLARNWRFEKDAAALNPRMAIHVYDPSVRRRDFLEQGVRSAVSVPLRFLSFSPRGARSSYRSARLAADYFDFFRGRVTHHERRVWYNDDRGSASIDAIVDACDAEPLSVFAKIDIEGTEYRVLPAIGERAELFTGLAVEFHDTDICASIFNGQLQQLRHQFEVVHVHGNNYGDLSVDHAIPVTLEISFLNRTLFDAPPVPYLGPLPRRDLDSPNDARLPEYLLDLTA